MAASSGAAAAALAVSMMPVAAMLASLSLSSIGSNAPTKIAKSSADLKHEQEVAKLKRKADFMSKRREDLGSGENAAQTRAAEDAFAASEEAQDKEDARALAAVEAAEKDIRDKETAQTDAANAAQTAAEQKVSEAKKANTTAAEAATAKLAAVNQAADAELASQYQSFFGKVVAALGTRDGSLGELVKFATAHPDVLDGVFISKFADEVVKAAENDRLSSTTQVLKELVPFSKARATRKAATKASQEKAANEAFNGGKRTRRRLRGGVVMTTEVSALMKLALYGKPNQKAVSEAFASIVTATPRAVGETDDELLRISKPAELLRGPFTEFINFRAKFLESNDALKRNCALTMFKVVLDADKWQTWRPVLFLDRAANINAWGAVALETHPDLNKNLTTAAKRVLGVKAVPGKVAAALKTGLLAAGNAAKSGAVGALGLVVTGAKGAPSAARAGIAAVSTTTVAAATAAYNLAQSAYDTVEGRLNSLAAPAPAAKPATAPSSVYANLAEQNAALDSVSTAASAAQSAQADPAFSPQGELAPTRQLNGTESDTGAQPVVNHEEVSVGPAETLAAPETRSPLEIAEAEVKLARAKVNRLQSIAPSMQRGYDNQTDTPLEIATDDLGAAERLVVNLKRSAELSGNTAAAAAKAVSAAPIRGNFDPSSPESVEGRTHVPDMNRTYFYVGLNEIPGAISEVSIKQIRPSQFGFNLENDSRGSKPYGWFEDGSSPIFNEARLGKVIDFEITDLVPVTGIIYATKSEAEDAVRSYADKKDLDTAASIRTYLTTFKNSAGAQQLSDEDIRNGRKPIGWSGSISEERIRNARAGYDSRLRELQRVIANPVGPIAKQVVDEANRFIVDTAVRNVTRARQPTLPESAAPAPVDGDPVPAPEPAPAAPAVSLVPQDTTVTALANFDADAALARELAGGCDVPPQVPDGYILTEIQDDGWCFYKAILAGANHGKEENKFKKSEDDRKESNKQAASFAGRIAGLIYESPDEKASFTQRYDDPNRRPIPVLNADGSSEMRTLTADEYLTEVKKLPVMVGEYTAPRVYGESALTQAAARVLERDPYIMQTKIAIYGKDGNVIVSGCPKKAIGARIIYLRFDGNNHFDVFLPTQEALNIDRDRRRAENAAAAAVRAKEATEAAAVRAAEAASATEAKAAKRAAKTAEAVELAKSNYKRGIEFRRYMYLPDGDPVGDGSSKGDWKFDRIEYDGNWGGIPELTYIYMPKKPLNVNQTPPVVNEGLGTGLQEHLTGLYSTRLPGDTTLVTPQTAAMAAATIGESAQKMSQRGTNTTPILESNPVGNHTPPSNVGQSIFNAAEGARARVKQTAAQVQNEERKAYGLPPRGSGRRKRHRTPKRRPKGRRGRPSRKSTFRRHRKH